MTSNEQLPPETLVFAVFQCKACFKLRPLVWEPSKRRPAPKECAVCGKSGVTKKLATSITYEQLEGILSRKPL